MNQSPDATMSAWRALRESLEDFLADLLIYGTGYSLGWLLIEDSPLFNKQVLAALFLFVGYIIHVARIQIQALGHFSQDETQYLRMLRTRPELIGTYLGVLIWCAQIFLDLYSMDDNAIAGTPAWQAFFWILGVNGVRVGARHLIAPPPPLAAEHGFVQLSDEEIQQIAEGEQEQGARDEEREKI